MGLLHWYIIPIAWELGREVLENFVQFVNIIEVAMCYVTVGTFARHGLSSKAMTLRSLSGV